MEESWALEEQRLRKEEIIDPNAYFKNFLRTFSKELIFLSSLRFITLLIRLKKVSMKLDFLDYLGSSHATDAPQNEIYDVVAPSTPLEHYNWYYGRYRGPTILITILVL